MRQVPLFKQFALLGSGRAAHHFSYYLETLRLPFWVWNDARNLAPEFFNQLGETSHVILLVSDSAIPQVAMRIRSHPKWLLLPESARPLLLHASGATTVEGVLAAHPLMTFPQSHLYPKDFYPRIPITIFSEDLEIRVDQVLPGLPNPVNILHPSQQSLYHALCVAYGNLPQLLWSVTESVRQSSFPLPREAFRPFLEVSLQNFFDAPEGSLTGPFVRKDRGTIQKHLDALSSTELLPLYSAFVQHFFPQGLHPEIEPHEDSAL